MRRVLIVGLIVAIGAVAAACGDSDESDPQADAVSRTYTTYIDAVKKGDGEAACELLTPAFQRRAGKSVAIGTRANLKGAACPKAVSQGALPQVQQIEPNLERIEVNGNRASGFDPGEGIIGPQTNLFNRIEGEWKISRTIFFQ
jgi:hypothetical protein